MLACWQAPVYWQTGSEDPCQNVCGTQAGGQGPRPVYHTTGRPDLGICMLVSMVTMDSKGQGIWRCVKGSTTEGEH